MKLVWLKWKRPEGIFRKDPDRSFHSILEPQNQKIPTKYLQKNDKISDKFPIRFDWDIKDNEYM